MHPSGLARRVVVCCALAAALLAGAGGALARAAQVCTGPDNLLPPPQGCFTIDTTFIGGRAFDDYVVTRPGSLYFDLPSRRRELARLPPDTAALYCSANPAARTRAGLPSLSFTSTRLVLHTQQWTPGDGVLRTADVARLTFTGLRTSDGLSVPSIELTMQRERGAGAAGRVDVGFIESASGPLVSGLHQVWFHVDGVTGEFTHPRFVTLPEPSRRLAFALFDHAPALLSSAGSVANRPGPADPPWTLATAIEQSTRFRDGVFAVPQPRFEPVVTLNCTLQGSYQTCAEQSRLQAFADYLQVHGADYLESGSAATAGGLLANLRAWAAADALSFIPGIVMGAPDQPDFVPKYTLLQFVMPMVTTWSLLRGDPLVTPADRALVDGWIDRVATYASEPFGGPGYEDMPWNPGYFSSAVRMAWGIVKGSHAAVGQGVERVLIGLHQMRRDGSFPRETARGACALGYQVVQTVHLLVLAELAARQGYDAYALSVDGKTLHDAVKFILDVLDNPALIAGYAAQNPAACNVPYTGSQAMFLPGTYGDGYSSYAWIEPYIARFPGHANSVRLARLDTGGLAANRPVRNTPLSGANTTCFSADRTPVPITPPATAVEYYHAGLDHYFVTAYPGEIDMVDGGTFPGWNRTGGTFGVFPLDSPGAANVCRFFSASLPKSSHFYTPLADECGWLRTIPVWQYEGLVFALKLPDLAGNCPAGTVPLYRLYNNLRSGAPNHRYTTQLATRSEMIGRGYVPEGFGPLGVIGCVPPR